MKIWTKQQANNNISLVVYFEVPLGHREEVKRKFDNVVLMSVNQ